MIIGGTNVTKKYINYLTTDTPNRTSYRVMVAIKLMCFMVSRGTCLRLRFQFIIKGLSIFFGRRRYYIDFPVLILLFVEETIIHIVNIYYFSSWIFQNVSVYF